MPDQDTTASSPAEACPTCRTRARDGLSLYAPNGAAIKPTNGHTQAPAASLPEATPAWTPAPELPQSDTPTQTIEFWQGLAIGLGAAIVILFLVAALLAA
jgi:hypothetical protein